jgi:hypothetical protein
VATRFGAADAHYPASGGGHAALVVSGEPGFGAISEQVTAWLDEVADLVRSMSGTARLPDALRLVDRLARAVPPGCSAEQMI